MDLDYKDRTFSFKKQREKMRRRKVVLISGVIFFLTLLILFLNYNDRRKIEKIETYILNNEIIKGEKSLGEAKSLLFHRPEKAELKGIIALISNDIKSGKKILENGGIKKSGLSFKKFLTYFSDNGLYKGLEVYSDFLSARGEETSFYRIISKTALFKANDSEKLIKMSENITRSNIELKLLEKIKDLNREIRSGKVKFIFDREDEPLAYFDLALNRSISLIPGISFREFDIFFKNGIRFFRLTIEKQLHLKLEKVFRNYYGSFILIDLEDGSMKGVYSKPFNRIVKNTAFSTLYEPASIMKILTLFTYLNKVDNIFPFTCNGFTTYDKKIFYDWTKHGKIDSYLKALSYSCNLAFAKIGISAGSKNIMETLDKFLFNSSPMKDLMLSFFPGKYEKQIYGETDLANLSIGLGTIKISTYHSALISALISKSGIMNKPHIIESVKNILNLGYYNHKPDVINIYPNNKHYEDVRIAMKLVVDDKRGTGRRAKVHFVETAIKTGTAGKKSQGFDSVITGFFPYRKPQFAFAFRLERGGKAELAGARFLKKFLYSFFGEQAK